MALPPDEVAARRRERDPEFAPRSRRSRPPVNPILVARAQNGDRRAWRELVERFQDAAVAAACAHVEDLGAARTAAGDGLVDALARIGEVRDAEQVPAFVGEAVRRRCEREPQVEAPLGGPDGADPFARVAALPRFQERAAVLLHALAELDDDAAGRFLGLPASTVHARLDAATRRLKKRTLRRVAPALHDARPSRDGRFVDGVMGALERALGA